jgi:hypothetical protein
MATYALLARSFMKSAAVVALAFAVACVPMTNSSALVCQTEGGDSVNVREVYGTWKMVKGYVDDPRSEEELTHDYDVLVVQTGGGLCRIGYVSQSPIETVVLAAYEHNIPDKRLTLDLMVPSNAGPVSATYSFSGTCGDPRMTLRYSNGAIENYKFRGKDIGNGCPF